MNKESATLHWLDSRKAFGVVGEGGGGWNDGKSNNFGNVVIVAFVDCVADSNLKYDEGRIIRYFAPIY